MKRGARTQSGQTVMEYFLILCVVLAAILASRFIDNSNGVFDRYFVMAANRISNNAVSATPPPSEDPCVAIREFADTLEEEIEELEDNAEAADDAADTLAAQIPTLTAELSNARTTVRRYQNQAANDQERIDDLKAAWPGCFSDPPDPWGFLYCGSITNQVARLEEDMEECNEYAAQYQQIVDNLEDELDRLPDDISKARSDAQEYRDTAAEKTGELNDLRDANPGCF